MKGSIRLVVGAFMIFGSLLYVEVNQIDPGVEPAIWLALGITSVYFGLNAMKGDQ